MEKKEKLDPFKSRDTAVAILTSIKEAHKQSSSPDGVWIYVCIEKFSRYGPNAK